jgi:hypothetical protein
VETREPGQGRRRPLTDGKVVRLPVDWLGPREELVPFGPSADDHFKDTGVSSPPLRAEDFWGESSAAIHDALEPSVPVAGRPSPAAPKAAPSRMRQRRPPRLRVKVAVSFEPLRTSAALRRGQTALRTVAAYLRGLGLPRADRRTAVAVSGAVGVAALLTFALLDSVGGVAHPSSARSGSLMTEAFRPRAAAALARVGESVAIRSAQSRAVDHGLKVPHRAAAQPRPHVIAVKRTAPVVSQMAEYTSGSSRFQAASPATSSSTNVPSGSGESRVTQSSSRPAGSNSGGSTATAAQSGSASGPVGPGAPFGPGHLG